MLKTTYLLFIVLFIFSVNSFSQINTCKFIFKKNIETDLDKQVYSTIESELAFLNNHLIENKKAILESASNKSYNEAILNLADLNNHALDVLIYLLKNQNLFNKTKGKILLYKDLQTRVLKFFILQGYTVEQIQNFVQSRFSLIQVESLVKSKSNKIGFIINETESESMQDTAGPLGFTNTERLNQPYGRKKSVNQTSSDNQSRKSAIGFLSSEHTPDSSKNKLSSIGFLQESETDVGYQLSINFDQRSSLFITISSKPKIGF